MVSLKSPCIDCDAQNIEAGCWRVCDRLKRWQTGDDPFFGLKEKLIEQSRPKGVEMLNGKRCDKCGGRVAYEDGVIFCVKCLRVFLRLKRPSKERAVLELLKRGWDTHVVERLIGVSVGHINRSRRKWIGKKEIGISQDVAQAMVELAWRGWNATQIGAKFKVSPRRVHHAVKKQGVGLREIREELNRKEKASLHQDKFIDKHVIQC